VIAFTSRPGPHRRDVDIVIDDLLGYAYCQDTPPGARRRIDVVHLEAYDVAIDGRSTLETITGPEDDVASDHSIVDREDCRQRADRNSKATDLLGREECEALILGENLQTLVY